MKTKSGFWLVAGIAFTMGCGTVKNNDDQGDDVAGGEFSLSATPGSLNIPIAGSGMVTITIDRVGDVGDVTLAAQGLPAGITATFATNPVTAGTNAANVTFAVAPGTAPGTSNVTIVGTAGGVEKSVAIAITAQTITVTGSIRSTTAGVTVRIVGKPAVTTGAGGTFTFTDVTPPYDLYVVGATGLSFNSTPTVYYFKGLTRPDPIVSDPQTTQLIALTQSTATVSGTKTGGDGTTPMMIVWDSGGTTTVAPNAYSFTASWRPSATTRAGVLYGLQFTTRATGAPNTFPGFGSSGTTTLTANTTNTVNLTLTAPQTAALTGQVTSPSGFPTPTIRLTQQLGATGSATLWTTSSTTAADSTIPVVAAGKSALFATATLDNATTTFVDPGLNAAKDVTFALPAPAVQTAPVNAATGVVTATPFTWTPTPSTIYEVSMFTTTTTGTAKARYQVYTDQPSATLPSVPELALPSNQSFSWNVNGYGPSVSVNDAASMLGLETVSSADFDGARHSFTNSTDRTFLTAP